MGGHSVILQSSICKMYEAPFHLSLGWTHSRFCCFFLVHFSLRVQSHLFCGLHVIVLLTQSSAIIIVVQPLAFIRNNFV